MAEDKAMSVTVENRRNRLRSAVAAVLTVLLLVPLGILFLQIWDSTEDERTATRTERQGVEYLTRLGPLLTALTDAQGAALQGRTDANPALKTAVDGVSEIDALIGADLGATSRWNGLRTKIEALPAAAAGGPLAVFQAHVEATELLFALYGAIGDNSRMVRDPDNDLAHLQRAVTVDLPETANLAARAADLSLLAANADADQKKLLQPQLSAITLGIDGSVGRLTDNLQAAVTDTTSRTLSSNLLATVDGFRQGIEGLVRAASETKPDPAALTTARSAMQKATTNLSGTILTEMDGLLRTRLDDLDDRGLRAQITAGAAVLLALLALVAILGGRRRRGAPPGPSEGGGRSTPPGSAAAIFGDNPFDPEPYGNEVPPTRRERSGVLR
jgi:hypothetical protein